MRRPSTRGIIVVTGGAGGIGRAVCRVAARRGYNVVLTYWRHEREAKALVHEIMETTRKKAFAFRADLSAHRNVKALFERIVSEVGTPIALVTCAAEIPKPAMALMISSRRLTTIWKTNFAGTFVCIQGAARRMKDAGHGGAIVTVSSHSARTGGANHHIDYAAAKAAIDCMTVGFARELAQYGIRVNAVSPGTIRTSRTLELIADDMDNVEDRIPQKRLGKPCEIGCDLVAPIIHGQLRHGIGGIRFGRTLGLRTCLASRDRSSARCILTS